MTETNAKLSFEAALGKLEKLVQELERGKPIWMRPSRLTNEVLRSKNFVARSSRMRRCGSRSFR